MMNKAKELVLQGDIDTLRAMFNRGELFPLSKAEKVELMHTAVDKQDLSTLKLLCSRCHGTVIDTDDAGRDLLHFACETGHRDMVQYVVEVLGLDPLRGDSCGITPYDLASQAKAQGAYAYLKELVGFDIKDGYRNPVARGFHPDPSVLRMGEDYYMVHSSFAYFPGLPISHSRDLVHWQVVSHAVNDLEAYGLLDVPGGMGYWAPDISFFKGRFWVTATLRRPTEPFRLQMITSAEKLEGPWSAPKFLPIDGIDPSLFTDVDGRRYMLTNPGVTMVEISDEGDMLGTPEMIYAGAARITTEGPHMLYKDGWYYLFMAEGGTGYGHMETVARSRNLKGPFAACPFNPILSKRQEHPYVQRSGHGKPMQLADGRWVMLYLCGRQEEGLTMMGRETALDPMTWTAEGWPMVNNLKGPSCLQKPILPTEKVAEEKIDWVSPRANPDTFTKWAGEDVTITAGKGLGEFLEVHHIARRQEERCFEQTAEVDVENLTGKAGLTGYYDENSWYLLALVHEENKFRLEVTQRNGLEEQLVATLPWHDAKAQLRVQAVGMRRTLQVKEQDQWRTLAELITPYLTDEGLKMGKRFTGAVLGMTAIGSGKAVFRNRSERMWEAEAK